MTAIGERDRRIEFQRRTVVENALGNDDEVNWPKIEGAWAKVLYGTGRERREAASERATQVATFDVETTAARRTVTEGDRIWFRGRGWNITSIAPIGRDRIDFTAVTSGS